MKRFIIICVCLLVIVGLLLFYYGHKQLQKQYTKSPLTNTPVHPVTTGPTPPAIHTIQNGGTVYGYGIFTVSAGTILRLIQNFTARKASFEISEEYGCVAYVNGSYYDTSNRPLGLFESDGERLRDVQRNILINGFLWENVNGEYTIAADYNYPQVQWAMQSGPLLIYDGKPLPLKITNDEEARRSIAFTDRDHKLNFITVFKRDEILSGPELGLLPKILSDIARQENLMIERAINLDGGSASVFKNGELTLSELSPVGSIFCIAE